MQRCLCKYIEVFLELQSIQLSSGLFLKNFLKKAAKIVPHSKSSVST